MSELSPHQYADLWHMKYQNRWVNQTEVGEGWKPIASALKRANLMTYELLYDPHGGYSEVVKLKETD